MKIDVFEQWKWIPDYEGLYKLSNYGRVYSVRSNKIIKTSLSGSGYEQVHLSKDGVCKSFLIHRLVAKLFVNNLYNLPEVNHKDENKLNNRFDNLEWCDRKYNNNYGTARKRQRVTMAKRPIKQCTLDKQLIKIWVSAAQIQRETGFDKSLIRRVCSDEPQYEKYKTAYGYIFEYA